MLESCGNNTFMVVKEGSQILGFHIFCGIFMISTPHVNGEHEEAIIVSYLYLWDIDTNRSGNRLCRIWYNYVDHGVFGCEGI